MTVASNTFYVQAITFEARAVRPLRRRRAAAAFRVELARSNRILTIADNESILRALRTAGITAASSCEEGI